MAPKNNQHFATVVRETMTKHGWTQNDVASNGGPSDTTLRKILDNEPVGVSTATLKKLDVAFGWDAGSAAITLAGGDPTTTTEIRGKSGQRIRTIHGMDDAGQESLELIRLAQIVHDARDVAHSQSAPIMTALAALLEEAAELVTRIVARVEGDGRDDAEWFIDQARTANNIRRQGDIYVIDNEAAPDTEQMTQRDVDLVGGWRRGGGESETRRRRREQDEAAENGDL
ncbi:immunity repressor [Gordonia phage Mellie]|nr:immunity repressor [Gordonia phage Mellie]